MDLFKVKAFTKIVDYSVEKKDAKLASLLNDLIREYRQTYKDCIYKSKWGEYFDLSHILLISQIYRGDFGDQTSFHVECKFRDKPIELDFCSELESTVIDYHKDLINEWIKYKNTNND